MKKLLLMILTMMLAFSLASYAQMTDDQVVEYVQSGISSGKSQNQIGRELLARGVTQAQLERLKAQYEKSQGAGSTVSKSGSKTVNRDTSGSRSVKGGTKAGNAKAGSKVNPKTGTRVQSRNAAQNAYADENGYTYDEFGNAYDEDGFLVEEASMKEEQDPKNRIFGHDIFQGMDLSFEPNENIATPSDYVLGPGDELLIEIWGYNEATINETISPEGRINISQVGPIYLSGLTVKEASNKIKKSLVSKYASIAGESPNTSVSVSLGQIRTITVHVMGEVNMPGTYRLSSFATVFNALYHADGVTDNGSLRAIKVVRGGKEVGKVDVYGYLFEGKSDSDMRLKEGDIVIVPPYVNLVSVDGNVKRPMRYEMKESEPVGKLLEYAGGFSSEAHRGDVSVVRKTGAERQVFTVKSGNFSSFTMDDGDEVTVGAVTERFSNKVEIEGAVMRPGKYELGGDIATVRQLVAAAGGLLEDAFLNRAVITREKADLTLSTISVSLGAVIAGTAQDVLLKKNDIVTVSSLSEIEDPGILTINGYVFNPGSFPYADNTTVEDLILMAGGLLDGASFARVDIARRVSDPMSVMPNDTLGVSYSFPLKNGLVLEGGEYFTLKPYDVVSVRKSPGYREQRFVKASGELAFPGEYVLVNEGERVSQLVERAGGITSHAFLKGATLVRRMNDEERALAEATKRLAQKGSTRDTIKIDDVKDNYNVAIQLDKALEKPGSDYDLILREGDELVVPEFLSTVKISGTVMYPNTVLYLPGKKLSYYINAAGGYGQRAKRSKVYIVYMNGTVAKGRGSQKIEPGCEIIVPVRPESKGMSTGEIISLGTSAASLGTMVATLVNLLK